MQWCKSLTCQMDSHPSKGDSILSATALFSNRIRSWISILPGIKYFFHINFSTYYHKFCRPITEKKLGNSYLNERLVKRTTNLVDRYWERALFWHVEIVYSSFTAYVGDDNVSMLNFFRMRPQLKIRFENDIIILDSDSLRVRFAASSTNRI